MTNFILFVSTLISLLNSLLPQVLASHGDTSGSSTTPYIFPTLPNGIILGSVGFYSGMYAFLIYTVQSKQFLELE